MQLPGLTIREHNRPPSGYSRGSIEARLINIGNFIATHTTRLCPAQNIESGKTTVVKPPYPLELTC